MGTRIAFCRVGYKFGYKFITTQLKNIKMLRKI